MLNNCHAKKIIVVSERTFVIHVLKLGNGCFVTISEGSERIGSMVASITTNITITTTIVPEKNNSFILRLLSENISTVINGISVVSIYLLKTIDIKIIKVLVNDIMKIIKNE